MIPVAQLGNQWEFVLSVAVAQINDKLPAFLAAKKRRKTSVNVTNLLKTDLPKGSGRKGGVPPRKKKPCNQTTSRIEMTVHEPSSITDEDECIPPAPTESIAQSPVATSRGLYTRLWCLFCVLFNDAISTIPAAVLSTSVSKPVSVTITILSVLHNRQRIYLCWMQNKYVKPVAPPNDLCIKHQEWRQFTSPNTQVPQSKYSNAYYHCKVQCVWLRFPHFVPSELQVPPEVLHMLTPNHKQYINSVFGFHF